MGAALSGKSEQATGRVNLKKKKSKINLFTTTIIVRNSNPTRRIPDNCRKGLIIEICLSMRKKQWKILW
jgi:hypothetical protein